MANVLHGTNGVRLLWQLPVVTNATRLWFMLFCFFEASLPSTLLGSEMMSKDISQVFNPTLREQFSCLHIITR
jgi:hypothetical protein